MESQSQSFLPAASANPTSTTYFRLHGLGVNDLPEHKDLEDVQVDPPTVTEFIEKALDEASFAIRDLKNYRAKKRYRFGDQYPRVKTFTKDDGELTWAARTSTHNHTVARRASWDDFQRGLQMNHSFHERMFTEDIFDANRILKWSADDLELAGMRPGFHNISMEVNEMYHHLPWLFQDRVFTVLVLTAQSATEDLFYVIQIPVSPSICSIDIIGKRSHYIIQVSPAGPSDPNPSSTVCKYNNYHPTGDQKPKLGKKLTHGCYCSVDCVKVMHRLGREEIVWSMVTASEAGGRIPRVFQRMAVPKKIAYDVPYFLDYVHRKNVWQRQSILWNDE